MNVFLFVFLLAVDRINKLESMVMSVSYFFSPYSLEAPCPLITEVIKVIKGRYLDKLNYIIKWTAISWQWVKWSPCGLNSTHSFLSVLTDTWSPVTVQVTVVHSSLKPLSRRFLHREATESRYHFPLI